MNQCVDSSEVVSAIKSVKLGKNVFMGWIFLALVIQAGGFVMLEFTDLMDTSSPAGTGALSSAESPTSVPVTSNEQAQALRDAFARAELIKVRLPALLDPSRRRDAAAEMAAATDSACVGRIGHVVLLYRPNEDSPAAPQPPQDKLIP